jgi:tetratricopeptide (TPR) repeat protein
LKLGKQQECLDAISEYKT